MEQLEGNKVYVLIKEEQGYDDVIETILGIYTDYELAEKEALNVKITDNVGYIISLFSLNNKLISDK